MAVTISMEKMGMKKSVPVGFSWTTLFFGFFVPLFRGDWLWFLIMLVICMCSIGIANIILSFLYNRIYVTNLIEKGWTPADDFSSRILREKGILG